MGQEQIQLDYARRQGMPRRWVRRWVILALLAGIGVPAWKWGPGTWERAKLLYWQHRCMTYAPPADQVVYEEDHAQAAGLAKIAGYSVCTFSRSKGMGHTTVSAAVHSVNCWERFYGIAKLSGNWGKPSTIAFLHELHSPDGTAYLVALHFMPRHDFLRPSRFSQYRDWYATVCRPAEFTRGSKKVDQLGPGIWNRDGPNEARPLDIRVYAGQPDSNDPSHFTIRYQMWGQEDVLDGRIDDAGQVTLEPRDPPKERW